MRKLFCIVLLLISYSAFAQKGGIPQIFIQPKIVLIGNAGAGIPFGPFGESHSFGIHGGLGGYFKVTDQVRLGGKLEENYFFGKMIPGYNQRFDPENILRAVLSTVVRIPESTILLGADFGVAFSSSGGRSQTSLTYGVSAGIPFLGKLPVMASFWSAKRASAARGELLFFFTPKILDPGDR